MTDQPDETCRPALRAGTVADVAAMLAVSESTIYRMVQRGEIPTLRRIGPLVRFDLNEVERWARER